MMKIAVLLTVHNRKDKTIECLNNLSKQKLSNDYTYDVFLTDDGCTDGTAEAVRKNYPNVCIISGDGSLYWNRGMWTAWNKAVKSDHYDFFLWLNDDTLLYSDCLERLLDCSIRYNNRAIVVGPCQSIDHSCTTYGGRDYGMHIPDPQGYDQEVYSFNGNIVLIPFCVYEIVGNLDYKFRHGIGDLDYGQRATKLGFKIYQVGNYCGECDRHEKLSNWCNPDVPLKKRWKAMFSPTGMNPSERFYYERRHFGFFKAAYHYILIYFRCLFPSLWIYLGHAKI